MRSPIESLSQNIIAYITLLILGIFVFSGCASVIEYMNRPDEVHERIIKEYEDHMKHLNIENT